MQRVGYSENSGTLDHYDAFHSHSDLFFLLVGKGTLHTYWLTVHGSDRESVHSSEERGSVTGRIEAGGDGEKENPTVEPGQAGCSILQMLTSEKEKNLIKWNVEVLAKMLKHIAADRRLAEGKGPTEAVPKMCITKQPLEEVVEVVTLPQNARKKSKNAEALVLDGSVLKQLRDFVTQIAGKLS